MRIISKKQTPLLVFTSIIAILAISLFTTDAYAQISAGTEKWWENITPGAKMAITAASMLGIAILIVFLTIIKPKRLTPDESEFSIDNYKSKLQDKIGTLKTELEKLPSSDSAQQRKLSAALKEAEERLRFMKEGYSKAVSDLTGLTSQLEILRGWISETEIETAESMLVTGKTKDAKKIWAKIANESEVKKNAYAHREADAYYHLAMLAKADLNYDEAMQDLIKGIETGKAGITHISEAAHLAIKTNDYLNAESLYKQALSMATGCDECTKDTIRHCQTGLADVYVHANKFNEALPLYKTALESCIEIYSEQSTPCADTYGKLAELYQKQGNNDETAKQCEKALNIYSLLLPKEHPKIQKISKLCKT